MQERSGDGAGWDVGLEADEEAASDGGEDWLERGEEIAGKVGDGIEPREVAGGEDEVVGGGVEGGVGGEAVGAGEAKIAADGDEVGGVAELRGEFASAPVERTEVQLADGVEGAVVDPERTAAERGRIGGLQRSLIERGAAGLGVGTREAEGAASSFGQRAGADNHALVEEPGIGLDRGVAGSNGGWAGGGERGGVPQGAAVKGEGTGGSAEVGARADRERAAEKVGSAGVGVGPRKRRGAGTEFVDGERSGEGRGEGEFAGGVEVEGCGDVAAIDDLRI